MDVIASLGGTIRQVSGKGPEAIQAANAVLREVIQTITFRDGDRDRPVITSS